MGAVDSEFTIKRAMLIPLHKNEGILLSPMMDTFESPLLWIDTRALILLLVTGDEDWKARWNADKTVLENHTLTQAEDKKFRKHDTSYAAVDLAFFPFVLGCFAEFAPRRRDFCALWIFWNLDSMMLS